MENGLTEAKISRLDESDSTFSERETLALAYAEKLAVDHHNMDDAFFDQLRTQFDLVVDAPRVQRERFANVVDGAFLVTAYAEQQTHQIPLG